MDFTEMIKENIRLTAERLHNDTIVTAEDMIPLMDDSQYFNKMTDIVYGDKSEEEKLDIFYPEEGSGPFPVFIEVHGGAWYFGQKKSVEFEPFLLGLKRGYACVSLGYTLSPKGHYPLPVIEIKSAIRFLRKNAAKYNLDPDRIALWGGSAGAHLAALAATSCDTGYLEEDLSGNQLYSAKPDILVLWYGCFDYFCNNGELGEWIYRNFFGVEDLRTIEETLKLSDPVAHITEAACPTLLQHGIQDSVVTYRQSERYYDALVKAGVANRCRLDLLPGCDHADARMFAAENVKKVFDFIGW